MAGNRKAKPDFFFFFKPGPDTAGLIKPPAEGEVLKVSSRTFPISIEISLSSAIK